MKIKKFFSLVAVLLVCVSSFSTTAMAVGDDAQVEAVAIRATGRFNMEVPGGTIVKANSSFPLEAGETVTIKASYTPFSASVDFGLIAPDGYVHDTSWGGGYSYSVGYGPFSISVTPSSNSVGYQNNVYNLNY